MSQNAAFRRAFAKVLQRAGDKLELVATKATLDIATSLVMKSPVGNPDLWQQPVKGYVGGRFRANWQVGVNQVNAATTPEVDATGTATLGRLQAEIAKTRLGGVVYITNSLPYAQRLEHGWSKQAPAGMVRLTVREATTHMRRLARAVREQRP